MPPGITRGRVPKGPKANLGLGSGAASPHLEGEITRVGGPGDGRGSTQQGAWNQRRRTQRRTAPGGQGWCAINAGCRTAGSPKACVRSTRGAADSWGARVTCDNAGGGRTVGAAQTGAIKVGIAGSWADDGLSKPRRRARGVNRPRPSECDPSPASPTIPPRWP